VTISPGEFIDFPFDRSTASGKRKRKKKKKEREGKRDGARWYWQKKTKKEQGMTGRARNDECRKEEWGSVLQLAKEVNVRRERKEGRKEGKATE